MNFLIGVVVGIWIGIIGASCIIAHNDGVVDRGVWMKLRSCINDREQDAIAQARVIASYQGAVMEIDKEGNR